MKLMLVTLILVGFEIQDNLATSAPRFCYVEEKCYDEPKDCNFFKYSVCETDDQCGEGGECSFRNHGGSTNINYSK